MSLERVNEIYTKEDLADFVEELREELIHNPADWENPNLERFLSAMGAWIRTLDMYAKNTGDSDVTNPSWSTFAKILCASKIYE